MKAPSVTNDTAGSSATEAQILAEAIIDTVRESLLVLHADLRVKSANHSFYESFQTDRADTEGRLVYELGGGQWDIPALRRLLSDILPNNGDLQGFEVDHTFATVGRRVMLLNARRIDHLQLVLLAIEDITERRRAEERQKLMMAELGHRMKNLLTIIQSIFELAAASSPSIEALRTAFPGRLHALVRTHDSLMKQEWAGTDLYELVRQESAPYDQDGGRVELDGPPGDAGSQRKPAGGLAAARTGLERRQVRRALGAAGPGVGPLGDGRRERRAVGTPPLDGAGWPAAPTGPRQGLRDDPDRAEHRL